MNPIKERAIRALSSPKSKEDFEVDIALHSDGSATYRHGGDEYKETSPPWPTDPALAQLLASEMDGHPVTAIGPDGGEWQRGWRFGDKLINAEPKSGGSNESN